MPKSYNIKSVEQNGDGTIRAIQTEGGMIKTTEQVIKDLNNGYTVKSGSTPVISVNNSHIRTVPNTTKNDNLKK